MPSAAGRYGSPLGAEGGHQRDFGDDDGGDGADADAHGDDGAVAAAASSGETASLGGRGCWSVEAWVEVEPGLA